MMIKLVAVLLGALTWSLCEYCIHRWLGHDARFRPNLFATEHIRHHSQGNYFGPVYMKVLATIVALLLVVPSAVLAVGLASGLAFSLGFVSSYLAYEVLHRLEHVWAGVGPYARWARRHHFWHHFGNPSKNHGVTSPLWDHVFGTYEAPGVVVVPERLMMPWLTDPATREVRGELTAHYQLRRAKTARA